MNLSREFITRGSVQSDGIIQHRLVPDSHTITSTHLTPIRSTIFCGPTYFKAEYSGGCTKKGLK